MSYEDILYWMFMLFWIIAAMYYQNKTNRLEIENKDLRGIIERYRLIYERKEGEGGDYDAKK